MNILFVRKWLLPGNNYFGFTPYSSIIGKNSPIHGVFKAFFEGIVISGDIRLSEEHSDFEWGEIRRSGTGRIFL